MDAENKPWWTNKEPNFSRLQAAMCRREVILGRDTVLKLNREEKENERD